MKRICSLLTALLLLFPFGCKPVDFNAVASSYLGIPLPKTSDEVGFEQEHTELSFSELSDDASDIGLTIAQMRELLFRIQSGELSGKNAQKTLDKRIEAFRRYRTAASIAYVRYCKDVTDSNRKDTYEKLSASLEELGCLLIDAELALSRDPALGDVYDEDTVEQLLREDALYDLSVRSLTERERELIGCYDALNTMTVSYAEKEWTKDEILSDPSLDFDTFSMLYRQYRHEFNERAGAIFLDLVNVRNELAEKLGFDSYPEYGYAVYLRDYSPQEAKKLAEEVKRELVPLFLASQESFYQGLMRLSCGTFSEQPTMDRVGEALEKILPELVRPWSYMLQHEMYDFDASLQRMPGSFTTYFEGYGAPFLFTSWNDSYEMPSTVLHEFGHYAGYYLNGGQRMQSADPLDLAEIDSQGLELLAISEYDILYGALADAARSVNLTFALYAVLTGCMEDEFQQFAYGANECTIDALNAEYARLAKEYGLWEMGLDGESWTEISHTFRSPMYYISYATSMLAALQLYEYSLRDRDSAINAYRSILMRPIGASFRKTIKEAGLSDPLKQETVAALGQSIKLEIGTEHGTEND